MGKHAQQTETRSVAQRPSRLILLGFLILAAIATLVGVLTQWPSSTPANVDPKFTASSGLATPRERATVENIDNDICDSPSIGKVFVDKPKTILGQNQQTCPRAIVRINSGEDENKKTLIMLGTGPGDPVLTNGEKIWLTRTAAPEGATYSFSDYQRSTSMAWWLGATILLIILVGLGRGARSMIGLGLTMAMVGYFLLPALVRGGSPIGLAVAGGGAVLFLALFIVHGVSWKTASALGGTLIALGLAALLARYAISSTAIRGLGSEDNLHILLYLPDVSVTGLMLCGFIIGALGVLNDVTVAQASTVQELSESDPTATPWSLFRSAMRVGQDHIASMVYTLVLSYTGAALPALLLLSVSGRPVSQIFTGDVMATELLRSAVGALALVMAVPITTAIAALTISEGTTDSAPTP